jgi:hypothetical protein
MLCVTFLLQEDIVLQSMLGYNKHMALVWEFEQMLNIQETDVSKALTYDAMFCSKIDLLHNNNICRFFKRPPETPALFMYYTIFREQREIDIPWNK